MKKILFYIVLIGLFYSCSTHEHSYNLDKRLFAGNSLLTAKFDFNLNKEELLDYLQSQIETDLCNKPTPINTSFQLIKSNIETLVLYDRECKTEEKRWSNCFPTPSFHILINYQGMILFEGTPNNLNQLTKSIELEINNNKEYYDFGKFLAFEIVWDIETPVNIRKEVFISCLSAYQNHMQSVSLKKHKKNIQDLNDSQIEDLKRNSRFAFYIREKPSLEPPPPPPDFSIVTDSIN